MLGWLRGALDHPWAQLDTWVPYLQRQVMALYDSKVLSESTPGSRAHPCCCCKARMLCLQAFRPGLLKFPPVPEDHRHPRRGLQHFDW